MNLGRADIKFLNSDPRRKMSAPAATWAENFVKAKDVGFLNGDAGSNSPGFAKSQVWEPIIESLNETEFLNNGERWTNPARYLISAPTTGQYKSERAYNNAIEKIFSTIRQNQLNLSPDLNQVNESFIENQTVELVNRERAELQKLSDDNPGFLYGAARFGGAMTASLSDPVAQQAMMLEGAVAIGRTMWRQLFNSAVLNGGAGAFSEIAVKEWYDELDIDYEFSDFVTNVSANAALGAALPLAGAGIKLTANQARRGYLALTGNNQRGTLENREMAAALLEAEEFEEIENPLQSATPNEAQYVHNQRLVEAGAAAANAQPPAMSPDAPLPLKSVDPLRDELNALDKKWEANNAKLKTAEAEGLEIQNRLNDAYAADPNLTKDSKIIKDIISENKLNQLKVDELRSIQDNLGRQRLSILEKQKQAAKTSPVVTDVNNLEGVNLISMVKASEIGVDAETFQFKAEGDEFGVTARLQGVQTFNPYWAGTVSVYEYADGRKVIADGHQRLGLAKRIMAQDPSQDISLHAYTFREVDGITPEEMRVVAALKNIVEGSGTAIDAAKVLRVDPSRLPDLPPNSELVQQARGIMPLSDNSFGMVVNGVVPAKYAAFVGRLIDDQDLQDAAMSVLAKANPENKFQAEAIVRQVKETPSEQVTQISLFGEELMTESYYFERGKILDRAYKELRRDKAAFETLVRNAERLEAEGNILAADANQRKAATDAQTITLLQALANRKGPLSDALNDAAKTARDTGSYGPATSGFLDAVRRSIDAGDFQSISAGDIGRGIDGTAEVTRPSIEEPILEGFDEPTGPASDQQTGQLITDMFGADEVVTAQRLDVSPIEEDLVAVQDIKMPIDDNLPPDQIRAQVQALTKENTPIIKDLIKRIDEKFGTESGDNIKDLAKVIQKANRPSILAKKPWHKVSHIRDSYRFKTVIEDFRDVPAIFDELLASGISLVKVDTGKLFEPKEWGWRIIAFDLRMPNGQLVEWYLPIKELEIQKKNEGHLLFEEWRNKSPEEISAQHDAYMATIERSFEGYDNAFQSGLDRLGISREEAAASWARAESSMLDAARKSPSSSGITTSSGVRGAETQVPSRVLITEEPDSVQSMTRDVPSSTSANLGAIIDDTSDTDLDITLPPDVNMDLEVPVGQRLNPETNELEAVSMPIKDLRAMMDEEDAVMKRLEFCTI